MLMARLVCYAAERNKQPILDALIPRMAALRVGAGAGGAADSERPLRVLEVASGTGEHAAFFAEHIPFLRYQPTEPMESMHDSIKAWTSDISSVLPPITLDVNAAADVAQIPEEFAQHGADVMVCINMVHISPLSSTDGLFRLAHQFLRTDGFLLTYGPYRVGGTMVESNVAFDNSLRQRNPEWGVRDLEVVEEIAQRHGLCMRETVPMPSNNLSVVWVKTSAV